MARKTECIAMLLAGGQGSSGGCGTTNSKERTARDLFHNVFLHDHIRVVFSRFFFPFCVFPWNAFIVPPSFCRCDHAREKSK